MWVFNLLRRIFGGAEDTSARRTCIVVNNDEVSDWRKSLRFQYERECGLEGDYRGYFCRDFKDWVTDQLDGASPETVALVNKEFKLDTYIAHCIRNQDGEVIYFTPESEKEFNMRQARYEESIKIDAAEARSHWGDVPEEDKLTCPACGSDKR